MAKPSKRMVRIKPGTALAVGALMAASFVGALAAGCGGTEFPNEGPGQPYDRATAAVPIGMVGVCKRPFSRRPPLVNPTLWEHAKACKSDTPRSFVRIGYGHESNAEAQRKVERMMEALREGPKSEGGNTTVLAMLRTIRAEGQNDRWLQDRIQRESARTSPCDFTYFLNTMEGQAQRLKNGDRCAVYAYDQVDKQEVCLFDTKVEEAVWLTSAWACTTQSGVVGKGESCHKLCAFDDYCTSQASCAAPDLDLTLCALGVCVPVMEPI